MKRIAHRRVVSALVAIVPALPAAVLVLATIGAPCSGEGLADLPPNRWTRLPDGLEPGYVWSQAVHVPPRGQVLHWGAVREGQPPRHDVFAFDPARGAWIPDHPAADRGVVSDGKGIRVWGRGEMLAVGTPAPSWTANGLAWDGTRRRLVLVQKGLVAEYDPAARKWDDIEARTELRGWHGIAPGLPHGMYEHGLRPETEFRGETVPGGPPVYGPGICHDPANDEILLFPHWGGQDADLRPFTGGVSSHTGTWICRAEERVWRRARAELGSPKVRARRALLFEALRVLSGLLDASWRLDVPAAARGPLLRALRSLEAALAGPLRVEPPPRSGAAMVFDPGTESIVLHGGRGGLVRADLGSRGRSPPAGPLDDTWLWEGSRREWREVNAAGRPPPQDLPLLVRDEASGLLLLVAREADRGVVSLWSLDLARGEWALRHEERWTGRIGEWATLALDPVRRVLLLIEEAEGRSSTWALRLELERLPASPAPPAEALPPPAPPAIPPDDPAWISKLRALPPNVWTRADPPREPDRRDWGTLAHDPARGLVVYFGGGHSTYQVNDVAVYAVGANRWIHAPGDHNAAVPPIDWDGCAMGFRGGPPAGHQRNTYVAFRGRTYVGIGAHSRRWDPEWAREDGQRVAWFHDFDRGAWRQEVVREVVREPGAGGTFGRVHLIDPAGRVLGFGGHLEPYDGRFFAEEAYFAAYDIVDRRLTVRRIPPPTPGWVGECRPFCYVPEEDSVFFLEYREGGHHGAWMYSVGENRFRRLEVERLPPPGPPLTVEHLGSRRAVLAIIATRDGPEQWIYSLARNAWNPLPLRGDPGLEFQTPYAQTVWVERHGVLVNVCGRTWVMRPEP